MVSPRARATQSTIPSDADIPIRVREPMEVHVVTGEQLAQGWYSFSVGECGGAHRRKFCVLEGPRPDGTFLVNAPGFTGMSEAEIEICRRAAVVLNLERKRLEHTDRKRREGASAWVSVCEAALRGSPSDRTKALERYADLVDVGVDRQTEDAVPDRSGIG